MLSFFYLFSFTLSPFVHCNCFFYLKISRLMSTSSGLTIILSCLNLIPTLFQWQYFLLNVTPLFKDKFTSFGHHCCPSCALPLKFLIISSCKDTWLSCFLWSKWLEQTNEQRTIDKWSCPVLFQSLWNFNKMWVNCKMWILWNTVEVDDKKTGTQLQCKSKISLFPHL